MKQMLSFNSFPPRIKQVMYHWDKYLSCSGNYVEKHMLHTCTIGNEKKKKKGRAIPVTGRGHP
jgi:hypothetical protein